MHCAAFFPFSHHPTHPHTPPPQDARRYPRALLKVLVNITDIRVLQYGLTLLEDFLVADPARCKFLLKGGVKLGGTPFLTPLLALVGTSGSGARSSSLDTNAYILEKASSCVALALSVDARDPTALSSYLAWVMTHLRLFSSSQPSQLKVTEVALAGLAVVLRNPAIRTLFVNEGGVARLLPLLGTKGTQMQYSACFCLWSFYCY